MQAAGGGRMPQPLTAVIMKSSWKEMLIVYVKRAEQETRCPACVRTAVGTDTCLETGAGGAQENCCFQGGGRKGQSGALEQFKTALRNIDASSFY